MNAAAAEHRAALIRFVLPRVNDHAAAEDIVHDVLLRAWERQSQLRDETKIAAWLYQMTRYAIVDHHRARKPPRRRFDRPGKRGRDHRGARSMPDPAH